MISERTVACPICTRAYKVYSMYAGDQSACPKCRAEAEEAVRKQAPHPHHPASRKSKGYEVVPMPTLPVIPQIVDSGPECCIQNMTGAIAMVPCTGCPFRVTCT